MRKINKLKIIIVSLLAIVFSTLLFSACSIQLEFTDIEREQLIGNWNLVRVQNFMFGTTESDITDGVLGWGNVRGEVVDGRATSLSLFAGGVFLDRWGRNREVGAWSLSGYQLTMEITGPERNPELFNRPTGTHEIRTDVWQIILDGDTMQRIATRGHFTTIWTYERV